MKIKQILTIVFGAAALVSCQQEHALPQEGRAIKFTASFDETKATDTAFEAGDRIGLTINAPVNVSNVTLVADGNTLNPEKPLYWPVDMPESESAQFVAYYPYAAIDVSRPVYVEIGPNQYKPEVYKASDYVGAVSNATPSDEVVNLGFKHLMSKFNITVVDQLETEAFLDVQSDDFQSVTVDKIIMDANINYLTREAEAGETAYPGYPARTGSMTYSLLLPPQTGCPQIGITLASGKTMYYQASKAINFASGKQVSATLVLKEDAISFSYEIAAWADDPVDVSFVRLPGTPPNDEIWYTSTDGNTVTPTNTKIFGANLIANTYENGKGILKFDGAVTMVGDENLNSSADSPFSAIRNLSSIKLPESVRKIGFCAFYHCQNLFSIELPSYLEYLASAINNCPVTEINIPETKFFAYNPIHSSVLQKFTGPYASADGRSLVKNDILYSFAPGGITDYEIPSGVKKLFNGSFSSCSEIEYIIIPDSVEEIGPQCFVDCRSLREIVIPESVTLINSSAFVACSSLRTIHIPENTRIGSGVFDSCTSLESFTGRYASEDGRCLIVNGRVEAFAPAGLTQYTIPDNATAIGQCFMYLQELEELTIPSTVNYIRFLSGDSLLRINCLATNPPSLSYSWSLNMRNLEAIYVPAESVEAYKSAQYWSDYADKIQAIDMDQQPDNEIWYTSTDGNIVVPASTKGFGVNLVSNTYSDGKGVMTFDGPLTVIPDSAFADCTTLESLIHLGSGLTSIEWCAFWGCEHLVSVVLPETLQTISGNAFGNCALVEVTIPESVQAIQPSAFTQDTRTLQAFYGKGASPDHLSLVSDGVLVAIARADEPLDFVIPEGVTQVGWGVFYFSDYKTITLPEGLQHCDYGFPSMTGLEAFYGPNTSEDHRCVIIDGVIWAFASAGLTTYTVTSQLSGIGAHAFYNQNSTLRELILPDSASYIGRSAFSLTPIETLVLPAHLKRIETEAFFAMYSLRDLTVPSEVEYIGSKAFSYAGYNNGGLEKITFMSSVPPTIVADTFGDMEGNCPFYVPAASVEAYKSAQYWSSYAGRIQAIPE